VDIIDAIDSATGCQQCGKDLSGSVSDDFCSEECQRAWSAARVGANHLTAPRAMSHPALRRPFCNMPLVPVLPFGPVVGDRMRIEGEAAVYAYNGERWESIGRTTTGFVIEEWRP
jgi:hypothetical protein